jgi:hypothetical protein
MFTSGPFESVRIKGQVRPGICSLRNTGTWLSTVRAGLAGDSRPGDPLRLTPQKS